MAILPLRGLGTQGIIKDIDPFDLPPTAFSSGVNVRFDNGVISRGPVVRNVTGLSKTAYVGSSDFADLPFFVDSVSPTSGLDTLIVGFGDGKVYSYTGQAATATNLTPGSWVDNPTNTQYTSTTLANVYYTNREDRVPWSLTAGAASFALLANWNTNWRTKVLRSFNSQLIALNMTKNGTTYPTMVKWSEFAVSGSPPSTWDETDPTNNAGENVLADMRSEIMDGLGLRSAFIIYSRDEAWEMLPSGDASIYTFRRLFNDKGIIGVNCVVEVDGKHYVFGFDDIYVHDGVRSQSIAQGRVREFVFNTMNKKYSERFFVVHHRDLNEVMFCYVSGDPDIYFRNDNGSACNRAASYNYVSDTWTFYDLPQVTSAAAGNIDTSKTYADLPVELTYETTGGSYLDQDDGFKRNVFMTGIPDTRYELATRQLYIFDLSDAGNVSFGINQPATRAATLGRIGIDLDDIQAELRGYKHITQIYPEGRVSRDGQPLTFTFGSGVYPEDNPTYGLPMSYDGLTDYKLDYRDAGRYLAMQIRYDDFKSFTLSGIDLEVVITGSR